MRVAIYARYSSDLQDSRSIDDQIALARERADREGWVITGIYQDAAISGASILNRPGILKLLADAAAHAFDAVLAEDIDRLSRDQEDTAGIHKRLAFLGIKIVTLADGELSKLHVGIKGLLSSIFLDNLAQKTRRGLIGRFKAGRSIGGRTFGYRSLPCGDIEIVPEEAEIIRRIFREYVGGQSPLAIVARLNREGLPSPRGGQWSTGTLNGSRARDNGILCNRLYVGEAIYGRQRNVKDPETGKLKKRLVPRAEWIVQPVPDLQIVESALFDAAQELRKAACQVRLTQRRRPRRMLSGLIVCGCCGSTMSIARDDRLTCSARVNKGTCDNRRHIRAAEVEQRVLVTLQRHLLRPDVVAAAVEAYRVERERIAHDREKIRRDSARELAAIERQIERVVDLIAQTDEGRALLPRLEALEVERRSILARAPAPIEDETLALHPAAVARYRQKVADIHEALSKGDEAAKEAIALVRELITRIVVMPTPSGQMMPLTIEGNLAVMLDRERMENTGAVLVVPPPRFERGTSRSTI